MLINFVHFLYQALENEDAALLSDSEALTESECDVTSDIAPSEITTSKNQSMNAQGKKRDHLNILSKSDKFYFHPYSTNLFFNQVKNPFHRMMKMTCDAG